MPGESFVIADGYTESGYIREQDRLHPSLRFKFRPMLVEERDTLRKAVAARSSVQGHQLIRAALASRVIEWDAKNLKGEPLTIEADNIRTIRPEMYDRLYAIVAGYDASDADPLLTPQERNEEDEAALQAAINGRTVGAEKETSNEKN